MRFRPFSHLGAWRGHVFLPVVIDIKLHACVAQYQDAVVAILAQSGDKNKKRQRGCLFSEHSTELHAVFLAEFFNATSGVDDFLFASVKRVAL